jgi:hypothetical protein
VNRNGTWPHVRCARTFFAAHPKFQSGPGRIAAISCRSWNLDFTPAMVSRSDSRQCANQPSRVLVNSQTGRPRNRLPTIDGGDDGRSGEFTGLSDAATEARRVFAAIERSIGDRSRASVSYIDFRLDHHVARKALSPSVPSCRQRIE